MLYFTVLYRGPGTNFEKWYKCIVIMLTGIYVYRHCLEFLCESPPRAR